MLHTHLNTKRRLALAAGVALLGATALMQQPSQTPSASYIVQGASLAAVKTAVQAVGGEITHELGVIRAVGARLTPAQQQALNRSEAVRRLYDNARVETAKKPVRTLDSRIIDTDVSVTSVTSDSDPIASETGHVTGVGAHRLHTEGITGAGVTVAVLDSGHFLFKVLTQHEDRTIRALAHYDAISGEELSIYGWADGNGHGTHVASIALNREVSDTTGGYRGIAPDADWVVVRAFDKNGQGSYADVIRGIDWIVENKDTHSIRVLNLSLSAPPRSYYWDDPLNQAVMAAWQAGILVVASAGNTGPEPMTIGVPGNVPYIITVGAMSDNYTPDEPGDDKLATFSSTGPTVEGFVKPDMVAPGGHVMSMMTGDSVIPKTYPEFHDGGEYFTMSGTSQSAAVVSGVAALILQADPTLSPDDVKCRLMASAKAARNADGSPRYGILQQGAGLVDAYAAVNSTVTGCANRGLDIAKDLAGEAHYAGLVRRDAEGNYYLETIEG